MLHIKWPNVSLPNICSRLERAVGTQKHSFNVTLLFGIVFLCAFALSWNTCHSERGMFFPPIPCPCSTAKRETFRMVRTLSRNSWSSVATNGTKATQHRKKEASPTTTYLEQCLNDVNRFRILFRSARSNLLPFRSGTVRETSIEFSRLNKNPDWPSRMESGGVVGRRSGRVRAKGFKFLCPQAVGFVSVRLA